jgi:methionyl-tRNA formyltransferase
MKVFLCGQKYFGWQVFNLLRELNHEIVGVCAPAEENGQTLDRLYKAAIAHNVPYLIPGGQLRQEVMPEGCDLIIAAHSYDYIGAKTLAKTRLGGIGYHPSLLPLHRGRDAIRWAIKMGDRVTGGTVYWLSANVDAGPIAAQDWCFIPPSWDATRLWKERLQSMGVRLFTEVLEDLSNGRLVAILQDESLATWEPAIGQPPLFRPDLPRIGTIEGFEVIATKKQLEAPLAAGRHWRAIAGG